MENVKKPRLMTGLDRELQGRHERLASEDSSTSTIEDQSNAGSTSETPLLKMGKKTRGRVKINMEFIDNKLRRYTTFSKRKSGIMKKAHELATLTGTQVMLLVASETGHVYTFATRKLQPILSSDAGKQLIQTCLNSPDINEPATPTQQGDQRMSAQGFEEPELSYAPPDGCKDEHFLQDGYLQKTCHFLNAISAQQQGSPSRDSEQQRVNSASIKVVNANMDSNKKIASLPFSESQAYALLHTASGSSHLDPQQLQLAAAASSGVRMQMIPVSCDSPPLNSIPTSSVQNLNQHSLAGTTDEGRITLINPYNTFPGSVAGVQPVLVTGSGSIQLPATAQVALLSQNQKKGDR